MELPSRVKGDILLPPGAMTAVRERLRVLAKAHDLVTVIACAFDHRTRILPFIYADLRMAPAGVRAIRSAPVACGLTKTRSGLQQGDRGFKPAAMRREGRLPSFFLGSSIPPHAAPRARLAQRGSR